MPWTGEKKGRLEMKMKRTARKAWKTDTGVQLVLYSWPEAPNEPTAKASRSRNHHAKRPTNNENPLDPFW